ncbi:MAG: hypothetical protein O3B11_05540, partial [Bacteroidetes bacterium]|nr:hypothetical protein [Bacteroidota bacterium]
GRGAVRKILPPRRNEMNARSQKGRAFLDFVMPIASRLCQDGAAQARQSCGGFGMSWKCPNFVSRIMVRDFTQLIWHAAPVFLATF